MTETNYNNISPQEAIRLQREMMTKVQLSNLQHEVTTIGGADISFNKYSKTVYAGIVVLSYPDMRVITTAATTMEIDFPYIPGLLAFREVPALLKVWDMLEAKPDVLVVDGHGIAHPRRLGIASHFGVLVQTPTIGCAKKVLCGEYEIPHNERFAQSELIHKGERIGMVLRTKKNCKPVYISAGNLITLEESMRIIVQCVGSYRIPEPTRRAHLLVNEVRTAAKEY